MTINQLSIFLENKKGTLLNVLNILKDANVQVVAISVSDTLEYGILRIICNDPEKAYLKLKDKGIAVAMTDVFAVMLENRVGEAARVISIFADAGISITYFYSFMVNGNAVLIFRTDNDSMTGEVINRNDLKHLTEDDLEKL